MGKTAQIPADLEAVNVWKVLPYLSVIVCAVSGLNVMIVLLMGIVLTGIVGIADGSYDIFGLFQSMADGMLAMSELIIMTLLAGGMLAIIRHNGGIKAIINLLTRRVNSARGAEFCIAALVCLINACTANNTVAIITTGPIAQEIAQRFRIDPRKSASLLDTTSCFTQGLLPYGAQMLIAAGLASVSPAALLPYFYYPMALGVAVFLAILLRYPRKYSGR